MKVALIGATGFVGGAVLKELLDRGHEVIAVSRHPEKVTATSPGLKNAGADVYDTDGLAAVLRGSDVVISAYNAGWTNPRIYDDFIRGAESIQRAVKLAGVKRLIVVGGAGSLLDQSGNQLVDSPAFPQAWKPGAQAARDYLNTLKKEQDLQWTFLSPAIEMNSAHPGSRTGKYRTGKDHPVTDENNKSAISVADLAVALVDEAETPAHIRQRFTVGY
jgi:putative NADH-flavin reductase